MKQNNIGRLISILHRQKQVYINSALKEYHITSAEYLFLLYLYHDNGATQDKMSSFLYINKSATARSIKSLEQKEYVIRSKDTADKRCNRVYLTTKALEVETKIKQRIYRWSDFLTEDLDQESINKLFTVLEHMADKVEHTNLRMKLEEL